MQAASTGCSVGYMLCLARGPGEKQRCKAVGTCFLFVFLFNLFNGVFLSGCLFKEIVVGDG